MKRCLACDAQYTSSSGVCPSCGTGPARVDGFCAYAPELAHESSGFKESYFSELARLEESNFWFRCRNELITGALEKHCPNFESMLEIGCGTGYVLSGIARYFPRAALHGSEIFAAGLGFAAARLPSVDFMQMDARDIPFADEFDVVGAFDVLEHIEEDERVLSQVHAALKPQGVLLLAVPQHPWLWSPVDEYACHVRRYSASDLHDKIRRAGFQIARSTSFVASLLPAMVASRFIQKKRSTESFDAAAELKISPWLNKVLFALLSTEVALIRRGVNFPVGGSRLVVARKI